MLRPGNVLSYNRAVDSPLPSSPVPARHVLLNNPWENDSDHSEDGTDEKERGPGEEAQSRSSRLRPVQNRGIINPYSDLRILPMNRFVTVLFVALVICSGWVSNA